MGSNAPFPIQAELTAIVLAYRNARLIADDVLPRVTVGKQEFKYTKYTMAEGFTVPDTKVGRKSKPNTVEFSSTELTDSTQDYALDDPIPQADLDNAAPNQDPLGNAAQGLANLIALDREIRAAGLVFAAANYAAANQITLSGTSQWSDYANSDPLKIIMDGMDACIMRPNILVLGRAVWSMLSRHPKIVKAVLGNAGDSGVARKQDLADLLELDEILVGEGWVNNAKKGQAASLARVWGKHASLLFKDKTATSVNGNVMSFGMTAQFGNRIAGSQPDPNIGMRGGQNVRVGESVKELLTANDLGYFIQNAIA